MYIAIQPGVAPERRLERIREGRVDIVTFASSSTVRGNSASLLRGGLDDLKAATVAGIRPITSATAENMA